MRKQLLTLACLLMATMGVNAQISKVALQHKGAVTLYDTDQIQIAIDNSVDGDTIFLNEGEFPGFTVNKKISVIGKGNSETKVTSNITIAIPNSPTLTARVLDGLNISGYDITVSNAVNSLVIRKCQFSQISFSGVVDKALIDRCNISSYISLSSNVVGLDVVNSQLGYLRGSAYTPSAVNVVNCDVTYNIYNLSSSAISNTNVTFINSRVYNYYSSYHYGTGCNYVKCAVRGQAYGIYQNCWNTYDTVCSYTKDQLIRDGYLGTDETCIGRDGGTTPYTLVSTAPKITDYTLKVDTGEKKLNVNVKVTPQ